MLAVLLLVFAIVPATAPACTLMGAAGKTARGTVLVAKTRDRRIRFPQVLVDVHEAGHLRFLGIAGDKDREVTSGMNERGVVVVSAKVSTSNDNTPIIVGRLLAQATSIDDVLRLLDADPHPSRQILMLGDRSGLACVETAPGRPMAVERRTEGWLVHTNHYRTGPFLTLNEHATGSSSVSRLVRASALVGGAAARGPLTPAQFMAFCRDHGRRPGEGSICRHPQIDGFKGGTLSAAVFEVPPSGAPRMWVCLGQPCVTPFVEVSLDAPIPARLRTTIPWCLSEVRRAVQGPEAIREHVGGLAKPPSSGTQGLRPCTLPGRFAPWWTGTTGARCGGEASTLGIKMSGAASFATCSHAISASGVAQRDTRDTGQVKAAGHPGSDPAPGAAGEE